MSLKSYHSKRNAHVTPEPWRDSGNKAGRSFVVQKHAASRLHYDFRLELGGVLKSWALPKGFPFKKGEKHLAVQVEDHPRSYGDFEGTIPEGQYGGGTVMLWDRGAYTPLSRSPLKDLAGGKLRVHLRGEKLAGEWVLVRMRGDGKDWLIIRSDDDLEAPSKSADDRSAKSGRNMKQLAAGVSPQLRKTDKADPKAPGPEKEFPRFIEVMKARTVEQPPSGRWFYEIKFDGWRALALFGHGRVRIVSRNQKDMTALFPEVAQSLEALDLADTILDGEIVALDASGRSSFQLLQASQTSAADAPLFYYAFDLLRFKGNDLRDRPIEVRKDMLREVIPAAAGMVRFSDSLGSDFKKLHRKAVSLDLEGLIGKRAGSAYESGRRSGAWIKVKIARQQEFVIAGYTEPQGSRSGFGAILVGYYAGKKLISAGKVGTGFNEAQLESLLSRFQRLHRTKTPYANIDNLTPSELRSVHWVRPELVAEVRFKEWTGDGRLRQPVFLGLRADKEPRDVVREGA